MTRRVITYSERMSRWQPDAASRLERAARELFVEQGFADTTVPQITERAGLTTRTFFRHFSDKREVLFAFDEQLPGIVSALMAAAPADHTPMRMIRDGLPMIADTQLQGALDYLTTHRGIVRSDEGLRERELRKNAALTDAIRTGFLTRGETEQTAELAAHLGATAFTVSVNRWIDESGARPLAEVMTETIDTLSRIAVSG